MERGKDWQVTLVQEDALLFNAVQAPRARIGVIDGALQSAEAGSSSAAGCGSARRLPGTP
jgi:hypothetical protein